MVDVAFRTMACVAVGVIGLWYPLWVDRKNDESADSRIGMIFLWSLPMILAFAIWATSGLVTNRLRVVGARRGIGLSLVAAIIVVCWSPIAYVGFGILWGIMRASR